MGKEGVIVGMVGPNATADEVREAHAAISAGLEAGALKPVVGRGIPLADASKAHVAVMEPGAYGKIVLVP